MVAMDPNNTNPERCFRKLTPNGMGSMLLRRFGAR